MIQEVDVRRIFNQVLDERGLDRETHMDHHRYIEHLLEQEANKEKRRERFRLSFIGALAAACVGGLIWVGQFVISLFGFGHN